MADLNTAKAALTARLAELDTRLHALDAELDSHNAADWEERAVEREDDEVLERLGQSGEQEIAMIRAALSRIDAGEYGLCTRCGGEIARARLDLLPATPVCAACAAK